jgi:hypothetical protein
MGSITLQAFKAAGMVVVSNELVKRGDRFSESAILDPLSSDISLGTDQVFLSNADVVAGTAPAGIFHSSNGATAIAATVGGTAAACATDLANLLAAGANMIAPGC